MEVAMDFNGLKILNFTPQMSKNSRDWLVSINFPEEKAAFKAFSSQFLDILAFQNDDDDKSHDKKWILKRIFSFEA